MQTSTYLPGQPVAAVPQPSAWWEIFNSPALDALETAGLAANPSIGQAAQTLAAAQDAARASDGAYLPDIFLGGTGQPLVSRQSYPAGPNSAPLYSIYSPTGTVTEDLGLFGARKFTFENGAALAAVQQADVEAARQTVAQNIALAAITYAGAEAQIAATQRLIAGERKVEAVTNGSYAVGATSELSVLQQQSITEATLATLPALQTSADEAQDRLAILTGQLPGDFTVPAMTLDGFTLPAAMPLALPSAYLANRPDLIAARAQVAAQNAALGQAIAKLYPDITLSATGGYAAETLNTLIEPGSAFWSLAGDLIAPLYQGGTLHAQKAEAQAQLAGALYAYHEAVLTAFGEAADGLYAVQNDKDALARAQDAANTATASFNLAAAEYKLGATDYTTVLTAEQTAVQQTLSLTQARTNLLLDIAKLQAMMAR